MKELIVSKGWRKYYLCFCGGSLREHYINQLHPRYEIRIRPTMNSFSILIQGMVIAGPDHGYKLESKMKMLEIWKA